jgi:hypothetical protein
LTKLNTLFSLQKETIKHNFNLTDHSEICIADKYVNCTCKNIDKVDSIKYLGLHMNSNLKWKKPEYLRIIYLSFLQPIIIPI